MSKSTIAGIPFVLGRIIPVSGVHTKNIVIPYNWKRESQALANAIANLKAEGSYPSVPTDGK